MRIWMKITPDKYQLPLMLADTAQELAAITGDSLNVIRSTASKLVHGKQAHGSWTYVDIDEDEEEMRL